ncbi:MAG TPA: biotin--[acetyl-CoA-carboxylase] ligase [Dehalococcoidia bacterium]|nr:biotin--[acetyl-CoA-carboxylase] ligase [Dehalococcoidia bacterium]
MVDLLDRALVERLLRTRYLGRNLLYLQTTASTQDVARAEAERGGPLGTAVLAEEQTAGRGRLGRAWVSPAGKNIHVTLVMRPPAPKLRVLSIVAPLAIAEALEGIGLAPRLKWPNDVLVGGRKIAGILIETELSGDAVKYALVGIGLNVNFDAEAAPEIAGIATSVRRELGRDASREELLAALLNAFEARYEEALEGEAVFQAWRSRLETLGRRVRATLGERVEEGVAEDVDAEGNLLVRRDDGSLAVVEAGDVTLCA